MIEVSVREVCPHCRNAELVKLAAALRQPYTPVDCHNCAGAGYHYRWVPLEEIMRNYTAPVAQLTPAPEGEK